MVLASNDHSISVQPFVMLNKILTTVEESGMPRLSLPDLDSVEIKPELDSTGLDLTSAESDSKTKKKIVQHIRIIWTGKIHFIFTPEKDGCIKNNLSL